MVIAVGNDAQFSRLCEAAGQPQMALDPRFANNKARVLHRAELIEALKALTRGQQRITKQTLHKFIDGLAVRSAVKKELKQITPHNYTGVQAPIR